MEKNLNLTAAASTIKSSDLYMTIVATLFTSPSPNLNGVCCSEQFIDDIVANQEDFVGLPLYADVENLERRKFNHLGHMYNSETDEFGSTMIGSFYKFEKTVAEDGEVALVGYARVMKRNNSIRDAILELFAENSLKFSFEISVGSYTEQEDGTIMVDKADKNFLEGMAIVSNPACPEAVALDLVAEVKEEEVSEMQTEESTVQVVEETVVAEVATDVAAEVETASVQEPILAEEEVAETPKPFEKKDEEPEEEKKEETAEFPFKKDDEDEKEEEKETAACDPEKEEETACDNKKCAEEDPEKEEETACDSKKCAEEEEEEKEEETACNSKKCAEELIAELTASINKVLEELAETRKMVEDQKTEIAELKAKKVVAEETINPFLAEINTYSDKYSLLDSIETTYSTYSLLD